MTPDPSDITDGMNLYAFVQNNALINSDEYGLFLISAPSCNLGENQFESTNRISLQAIALGRNLVSSACHEVYDQYIEPIRSELNRYTQLGPNYNPRLFDPKNDKLAIDRFFGTNFTHRNWNNMEFTKGEIPFGPKGLFSGATKTSAAARGVFRSQASIQRIVAAGESLVKANSAPNIHLNRFHQAAYNLSETGQNNIRILRGWAKSKGWKKLPNLDGKPEVLGLYRDGGFDKLLKIKPEASFRIGLDSKSGIPRFDARLSLDKKGQTYINPFTGKIGSSMVGEHIPLGCDYY